MKKLKSIILGVVFILFLTGCSDNSNITDLNKAYKVYDYGTSDMQEITKVLSEKFIYFGHQSVGQDILNGIEYYIGNSDSSIELIQTRELSAITSPAFVHFRVGENMKPIVKIDDFSQIVSEIDPDSNAVAFFKFCYVDIAQGVNIDSVFSYYKSTLHNIKAKAPGIKIILFTVPIKTVQSGLKALAIKAIYGSDNNKEDNILRDRLNNRIKSELGREFPVFDLAKVEATLPNGTLNTFKYKGTKYPALSPLYTTDGGHLNEYGSKIVAYNLLAFLANEVK